MAGQTITTFAQDLASLYGDWGVDSEIGKLRSVLMHRPGGEIEGITREDSERLAFVMTDGEDYDPELVRRQHDAVAQIYKENGVQVHYVEETDPKCPNAMFCRDLVLGTPEGVIMARPGISVRLPEVRYAAQAVAGLGVRIIKTVNGSGTFDGACIFWIDRETVIFGTGTRCNSSGYRQVCEELSNMGVNNIYTISIPRRLKHLDGMLAIADYDVALAFSRSTPELVYEALEKRGFRVLEIPTLEERDNLAANLVALEPGKVVMPAGNPKTRQLLVEAGIECIEVDVSELKKGGGALHCITAFLKREPIPVYPVRE